MMDSLAAEAAATRAALSDALTEDEQLRLMRAEFANFWTIAVCDGEWEALPWHNMREEDVITAPSAVVLYAKILQREGVK